MNSSDPALESSAINLIRSEAGTKVLNVTNYWRYKTSISSSNFIPVNFKLVLGGSRD